MQGVNNLGIENLSRILEADPANGSNSSKEVLNGSRENVPQTGTFSDALRDAVEQVNTDQVRADNAIQEFVSGKTKNIHETMLAIERAELSLKMMTQVRNKVLDAYKEIMRMQI